ncbi:hypothetical protein Cs7R123_48630 [Catellatospora sp. TT07R-123]|uniref:nucleotidyltransferase family protein n=1 Tax=Catellatospora sp. TT07R-123 TaxID=2733863 RepID=UPI001B27F3C7|nr:nucleotidyltransferase family protein [Catellatospora sp. TT07R-123]GHJ47521.1 hypothetical protein Cs7R123_48630 [Catellatospora sp. TT07R-123]
MWIHASPAPVTGLAALAVRSLREFPRRLPAAAAANVLSSLGDLPPDGTGLLRLLMSRRLAHIVRAVCGELPAIGGPDTAMSRLQEVAVALADLHLSELRVLREELAAKGVPLLVPKGTFYAASVYPQLEPPFGVDVDLVVRREDVEAVDATLRRLGYTDDLAVRSNLPVRLPPARVAEENAGFGYFGQGRGFVKLVRTPALDGHADFLRQVLPGYVVLLGGGQAYLCPSFDVHHSLNSLHDTPGAGFRPGEDDWWRAPQQVRYRGVEFEAPDDVTVAWFAANHLYADVMLFGDGNLKILGDLIALVRAGRVDWAALAEVAGRHVALRPPVFYVFRMLRGVFGCDVPADFLAALDVPSPRDSAHFADFGDPLARLLDVRAELTVGER